MGKYINRQWEQFKLEKEDPLIAECYGYLICMLGQWHRIAFLVYTHDGDWLYSLEAPLEQQKHPALRECFIETNNLDEAKKYVEKDIGARLRETLSALSAVCDDYDKCE